jgi:hypothetical protein
LPGFKEKPMRLFATIVSTCVLMLVPIASAGADPDTGRIRVLDCGAAGSLTVVLNPNAFSTSVPAFHDVSSNAVLTPLNVRVDGQFVLRSAPGVVGSAADVVSCSYTDPAGLFVEITGVLSGR